MIRHVANWVRAIRSLGDPATQQWIKECSDDFRAISTLREAFPSCFIDRAVLTHGELVGRLSLGSQVRLARGVVIALSEEHDGDARLSIGDYTYVGEYCNLRAAAGTSISIGAYCLISQFCSIIADNHAAPKGALIATSGVDPKRSGVSIGDDVWLGVGTNVLAGVDIGRGAVVGANSVVTKSIPDNEIWAGCPAIKIGERA